MEEGEDGVREAVLVGVEISKNCAEGAPQSAHSLHILRGQGRTHCVPILTFL